MLPSVGAPDMLILVAMMLCVSGVQSAPHYACPPQSWCVPNTFCLPGHFAYQYTPQPLASNRDSGTAPDDIQYMCGRTVDSEGTVCCRNHTRLPTPFTPTSTNWFYMLENSTTRRIPVEVTPWPGYVVQHSVVALLQQEPPICPPSSVCTPATVCPASSITYAAAIFSKVLERKYQCGGTWDTRTWSCCSLHTIVNALYAYKGSQRSPDDHGGVVININFERQVANKASGAEVFGYRMSHHLPDEDEDIRVSDINVPPIPDYYEREHAQDLTNQFLKATKSAIKRQRRDAKTGEGVGARAKDSASSDGGFTVAPVGNLNASLIPGVGSPDLSLRGAVPPPYHVHKRCGRPLVAPPYDAKSLDSHVGIAKEGQYPWHVAILTTKLRYLCAGVVIADRHVLTVAHCVHHLYPRDIVVRVGDFDLSSFAEHHRAYDVAVRKIIHHSDYTRKTLNADISVVELEYPVLHLPNVAKVCLPAATYSDHKECYVPSWGFVQPDEGGSEKYRKFSHTLKDARFVTIEDSECQRRLRDVKYFGSFFKLLPGFLCGKGILHTDTCHGDGGSGLVCQNLAGDFVLHGLVSWSMECGHGLPIVFVDIKHYLQFILYTTGALESDGPHSHEGAHIPYDGGKHHLPPSRPFDHLGPSDYPGGDNAYPHRFDRDYETAGDRYEHYNDDGYLATGFRRDDDYLAFDYRKDDYYRKGDYYRKDDGYLASGYVKDDGYLVSGFNRGDGYLTSDYRKDHHYRKEDGYLSSDYRKDHHYRKEDGYVISDYRKEDGYLQSGYRKDGYLEPGYLKENGYLSSGFKRDDGYLTSDYRKDDHYRKEDGYLSDYRKEDGYLQSGFRRDNSYPPSGLRKEDGYLQTG